MLSFHNRTISISEFSSCVTLGGRLCQSCSELQNYSARDFHHSKQCKYLSKFFESSQEKTNLSSGESELRMFFFFLFFPATMLMSLRRAPAWRLDTKLYKFVWNIMSNNSSTENSTDLRLRQSPYLFIVIQRIYFFIFILMAWQWEQAIAVPDVIHKSPLRIFFYWSDGTRE